MLDLSINSITFYPIVVDFKDDEDKGSRVRIPVSALMKKISVQLNQTTKLLTIRPDTLEFIYTKGKAKKVPVKLQGKVALDLSLIHILVQVA